MGTKTITMYVSDIDQSEIPAGQAYQLSIRHPDGSTQQLDISEKNYRDLKLAGVGKTLGGPFTVDRSRHPGQRSHAGELETPGIQEDGVTARRRGSTRRSCGSRRCGWSPRLPADHASE